ncbi:optix-binding protein [Haematobia irritans]|uniref:optix-binding protein n=1 Tax=Haematobia irritans TaxID=7368 RepID=UPI003F4F4F5F
MDESGNVDFIEINEGIWQNEDSNEYFVVPNNSSQPDLLINGTENIDQYSSSQVEEEEASFVFIDSDQEELNTNDLSKHNLVLKEVITDQGQIIQKYFCQECSLEYHDINEFLIQHPGVELLSEHPEDDVQELNEETIEGDTMYNDDRGTHKLWDLVEDIVEDENEEISPVEESRHQDVNSQDNILKKSNPKEETYVEQYFCYECGGIFDDIQKAEDHRCGMLVVPASDGTELQEETAVNDLTCSYCKLICSSYDALLNHMTTCVLNVTVPLKTTPAEFHCDSCGKVFHNKGTFRNHVRMHRNRNIDTAEGPVKCEICNTVFETSKNLKLHMKMHNERSLKSIQEALPVGALAEYNELNQFFCEICNKSFDQKLLVIHRNMHQNVEEYNCSKCNKQFDDRVNYEMHLQMHKETTATSIKKPIASNVNTFNGHKKHACQYCGKEFQRPYEKVKHERIHTGEKPFNCEVCGKSFRVSYSLTLHLRTHTDIRPYVCAICNKRFKQQSVYAHHLKTHSTERQYKCEECGKSFRTSVQLCSHRNSHNKPFSCNECNRSFVSMYAVRIHMQTHNESENLKNGCYLCGARYSRIFALRLHIKEQHGIDVKPAQLDDIQNRNGKTAKTNEKPQVDEFEEYGHEEEEENDKISRLEMDSEERDDDLDETMAATKTILENKEIVVDNFHAEEIITDWLK